MSNNVTKLRSFRDCFVIYINYTEFNLKQLACILKPANPSIQYKINLMIK